MFEKWVAEIDPEAKVGDVTGEIAVKFVDE